MTLFSTKYAMRTSNFVPGCTQGSLEMGLNLFSTTKLFSFVVVGKNSLWD